MFEGLDLDRFWNPQRYAREMYVEELATHDRLLAVQRELGYVLPASYVVLMATQNGGIPINTCHGAPRRTSWAEDHVQLTGLFSIGRDKHYSLCGPAGSRFYEALWDYPGLGVYFANCPSAGHDMLCLDYRACGPIGEPAVVHVDQEADYAITPLAATFEAFILGLRHEEDFRSGGWRRRLSGSSWNFDGDPLG